MIIDTHTHIGIIPTMTFTGGMAVEQPQKDGSLQSETIGKGGCAAPDATSAELLLGTGDPPPWDFLYAESIP